MLQVVTFKHFHSRPSINLLFIMYILILLRIVFEKTEGFDLFRHFRYSLFSFLTFFERNYSRLFSGFRRQLHH